MTLKVAAESVEPFQPTVRLQALEKAGKRELPARLARETAAGGRTSAGTKARPAKATEVAQGIDNIYCFLDWLTQRLTRVRHARVAR
jgi:hypothetical protein